MTRFRNILTKIHNFFVANKQQWIERLKKASVFLFGLAILLLPFNWLPYFSGLKEFTRAGSNYPMYLACITVLIYKLLSHTKYKIPHNKLFHLFIVFITFASIFGGVIAIFTLSTQINGHPALFIDIEKLFYQEILLSLFTIFSITIYNIVVDNKISLEYIRTKYIESFYIPALYSLFEIVYIYTGHLSGFLYKTSPLLRPNWGSLLSLQLHSVSAEPAWFGIYIGGLLVWFCSYWFQTNDSSFNSKLSKYILYPYLIFITVLTSSRAAYVIIVFGILLFIMLFLSKSNNHTGSKLAFKFVVYTTAILALSLFSLKLNTHLSSNNPIYRNPINATVSLRPTIFSIFHKGENLVSIPIPASFAGSNVVRIGGALAALNISIHYPFTGVGLAQCPRYIYAYSSETYKNNPEIINVVLKYRENARFSAQNLLARIACEEGFLGFGIFILAFILSVMYIYKQIEKQNILYFSLFVSFCILLADMFVYDYFTFSEYWLILPLTWIYFDPNINCHPYEK